MSLSDYRTNVEPFFAERGFHEMEIGRTMHRFGNFAHVLSAYEARTEPDDDRPERRGVNSIQCYNDGHRWWVANMIWDNEREGLEIPEAWLNQPTGG